MNVMLTNNGQSPILEFMEVTKSFGQQKVINKMSFSINDGELFGLIGASGSGKTTLLKLLIGYYSSDSGKILYNGENITKKTKLIRQIFGFTTQDSCFYEELTLLDNLAYFGTMYGMDMKDIKERSEKLLSMVGLLDSRTKRAGDLSGGMQRRLDLCISLLHNPKILILDEPTTGLDPLIRHKMWDLIKTIHSMGVTVIISSHLLDEMEYLCTDVAMIQNGKMLIKGTPEQLKLFYSRNQEVQIETRPANYTDLLLMLRNRNIMFFYPRIDQGRLIFYTPDGEMVIRVLPECLLAARQRLLEIRVDKPNLDEVFQAFSAVKN